MSKKEKACLKCKTIYEGDKCPACGESAASDSFKGRIYVFKPEESEIAKNMKISQKGEFAIKTK
jgi:DNA-directed RNA polymerase subunit E"